MLFCESSFQPVSSNQVVNICFSAAALPALVDLQLTPGQHQDVQVAWHAHQEDLAGYWLTWEQDNSVGSTSESAFTSAYVLPTSRVTHLTHLAASSRVCVSPVYSSGRGDGMCCTVPRPTGWLLKILVSSFSSTVLPNGVGSLEEV